MGNDIDVRIRWLKSGRARFCLAAAIAGLVLSFGIIAMSRLQADDHTAANASNSNSIANSTAPGLMPLPPIGAAAKQVPVAPSDAASTTASDDSPATNLSGPSSNSPTNSTAGNSPSAIAPTGAPPETTVPPADPSTVYPSTAPISTNLPAITLPPPIHPSLQSDGRPTDATAASATPTLHAEVTPTQNWAMPPTPAAAKSTAATLPANNPPAGSLPDGVATDPGIVGQIQVDKGPVGSLPAEANAAHSVPTPASAPVTPASAMLPDSSLTSTAPDVANQPVEELPELPPLVVAAPRFKEIVPGVTTSEELVRRLGEGKLQKSDGGAQRIYVIAPYPRVAISLEHHRVSAIDVQLDQPTEPDVMAKRFHLDPDSSVTVVDEAGQPLGLSYPDRGTLLSYGPGTKLVSEMLLEPIDPQPFLSRAEHEFDSHPAWGLRDIDYSLSLDPMQAEAHDMRAQILLAVGRSEDALKSASRSVALATGNTAYLLTQASILDRIGRHDEAIQITQTIVDRPDLGALQKAHALCQLGQLTAETPGNDNKAMDFYMSAIKTAQPLTFDKRVSVRRLAKQVLLDAHLGAASDIAWGVWQKKSLTVARWIGQADKISQDLVEHEDADPSLRLAVARSAVSISVGTEGKWDATDWIEQALDTGRKLIADADDPLRKAELQWELGAALVDALELQRSAGLNAESISHGMSVLKYLQAGVQYRQRTSETLYVLGRAYFQIGVIHAVVDHDHAAAVAWFDRAMPLLEQELPASAKSRIGRNGELMVSMGISYWQTGNREEGLRLTERGMEQMRQAVEMKLLNDNALAVPYGNLAAMHRQMGHSDKARSYAEMAAQHDTMQR